MNAERKITPAEFRKSLGIPEKTKERPQMGSMLEIADAIAKFAENKRKSDK